ncbi:hypothetical protein DERP_003411 [Dermatophagoides pteronyssinus]|uniref:Uncharacterized protein n=1 Tax=Dermatophagoides pteronyssinus TaxID=6956 RepID=A0ABQ8JJF6_DERPT|nr:hypothetical protein DERP_003411 [Dermatophagoides pteronyssinus]
MTSLNHHMNDSFHSITHGQFIVVLNIRKRKIILCSSSLSLNSTRKNSSNPRQEHLQRSENQTN